MKNNQKEYLEDLDHYDEGMGIHSTSYKNTKQRLIRLAQIESNLQRWYELLNKDGGNTKELVREEIEAVLEGMKNGKSNIW